MDKLFRLWLAEQGLSADRLTDRQLWPYVRMFVREFELTLEQADKLEIGLDRG